MSGSTAALPPAVYVDVDGLTGYKEATNCTATMTDSRLLEALAESRVFKARFAGVDLSLCRVYVMGHEEPASNTTTGGTLLSGKRFALSIVPAAESASEVYLRIDTSAARPSAAAAGAFSRPLLLPSHVVLRNDGGAGQCWAMFSPSCCAPPCCPTLPPPCHLRCPARLICCRRWRSCRCWSRCVRPLVSRRCAACQCCHVCAVMRRPRLICIASTRAQQRLPVAADDEFSPPPGHLLSSVGEGW